VSGDDGFDDFYRGASRRVLQYAYAMAGDFCSAQDLTQEAFLRAWRSWSRISRYENPEGWVRLTVFRLATDRWRRLAVRRRAEAAGGASPPAGPPSEDTVLLVAALRQLPPRQRQAVCLHYLLDLPVTEIARETGAAVGTVKSWLSRGRAALAAQLADRVPSTPADDPNGATIKEGNGVA
jgi:RNA polymerase sigma-70 factor, ECF subfamily